jgi:hypothetical protein
MPTTKIAKAYKVFHQLPGEQFSCLDRKLSVAGLGQTHIFVTEAEARSLEGVFIKMQAEAWSPNGEARALIRRLGLLHTSMSVNDVVQDPSGGYWQCLPDGWNKLS